MKNFVSFGIGIVVGGAISAADTYKYFKEKSDKEIEEIKDRFREKENDLEEEIAEIKDQKLEIMAQEAESQRAKDEVEKPKKSKKKSSKKDADKPVTNATDAAARPEMEYTDYAAISNGKNSDDEAEEEKSKKKTTKKKSTKKKKESEVVVITEEEWIDNPDDMSQITMYVTPTGNVINGSTEQKIDPAGSVSQEMVDAFLESNDSVWYVRNNKLFVMYELVLDEDGDYDVY